MIIIAVTMLQLIQYNYPPGPMTYPDPREWDQREQRRHIPREEYRPRYDDEQRFGGQRGISPNEYERRSFCAMHPRECR